MPQAKPFIKWVGGKTQLLGQLESLLPAEFEDWSNITYIEPFVGGGAMLFHMLQSHPNIKRSVINDINADLTTCYKIVRDKPKELIASLRELQERYLSIGEEEKRKEFYLERRAQFNKKGLDDIENTTLFFFLNRTCFNGLYRVNKSGAFNVPFGRYANPTICDAETILVDSRLLQNVEIMTGDFELTLDHATGNTLFYFDPPYRPLSSTSSFNDYAKESFNDDAQKRLKLFCDRVERCGYHFMLSNSDCLANNGTDRFFDDLYADYHIERVLASRCVNANGAKRGKLTELLIHNYSFTRDEQFITTKKIV